MKKNILICAALGALFSINNSYADSSKEPLGCIVKVTTGERYCLPAGSRSDYTLPKEFLNQDIYVSADPSTEVMLSDYANLAYNRVATFVGTVEHEKLKDVKAASGDYINVSRPRSMRVKPSNKPLGCIVKLATGERYCLPAGSRSGYALPKEFINQDIYVSADPSTEVMLSDYANLAYNRVATFVGTVEHEKLKDVKAASGDYINVSRPRSMRVKPSNKPLGCIKSTRTNAKFCLPVGGKVDILPDWILNDSIDVEVAPSLSVLLSDKENMADQHIAGFKNEVQSINLEHVMAWNGEYLDFSKPRSMRVVAEAINPHPCLNNCPK